MGYYFAKGAVAASYSAEVLADSPVGYWRLDETSGTTANDSSGNARHGTYVNSPTLNQTGGLTGNAAVLFARASSQRVNLGTPSALNIIGQITLECLYKPTTFPSGSDYHALITHGYGGNTGYGLYVLGNSGTPQLQVSSFGINDNKTVWTISGWSTGQWRHIAAGWDGTDWKIFINGTEVSSTADAQGALTSTATCLIGANSVPAIEGHANGTIDEVAIYNTWLGSTRIAAHAAAVA